MSPDQDCPVIPSTVEVYSMAASPEQMTQLKEQIQEPSIIANAALLEGLYEA
jgi:hypothetical protein